VKNIIVGVLVVVIALLMGFIIFSFNSAFTDVINSSCSHGETCPMWETLDFQTNVSIAIMAFVIIIGLYLIFFGKEEKIITKIIKMVERKEPKTITKESYSKVLSGLSSEEKVVVEKLIESKGSLSQSDLIEHTDFNKVRISRILDRLEGRGVVERKRHGMSNIVVLK